jgi:membrane associated rhomboid family serine protease
VLPLRDLNPHRRRPVVTWALVAINIAVFFFVQPSSFVTVSGDTTSTSQTQFLYQHALVPCEVMHWRALTPSLARQCTRDPRVPVSNRAFYPGKSVAASVLASMFFHANLLHLLGNMWFLWVFGDNVEDRLGPLLYLAFYALGGVAAAAGQVLSDPGSIVPVVGASGAIAAVLGAYLVFYPRARIVTVILPIVFLPFVVSAWVLLLFWFVSQFFTIAGSGVAWMAHVAGFAAGVLGALVIRAATRADPPAAPGDWFSPGSS